MIQQKAFYFVRHGETDFSLSSAKVDHGDVSLNPRGRQQAQDLAPVVAKLPIQVVFSSPLKRAKETREIITSQLNAPSYELPELGECTREIWQEMVDLGADACLLGSPRVKSYLQRVLSGINQALSFDGPALIVSHAGVHWALCCLMKIENHDWVVSSSKLIHFIITSKGKWISFSGC